MIGGAVCTCSSTFIYQTQLTQSVICEPQYNIKNAYYYHRSCQCIRKIYICVSDISDTDKLILHQYNHTDNENNKNKLMEEEEKKGSQINMSSILFM